LLRPPFGGKVFGVNPKATYIYLHHRVLLP
jgi:hypothetical protein